MDLIKSALHNLSMSEGSGVDYCQGLVVGIVSGLMYGGMSFDRAIAKVKDSLPSAYYTAKLPRQWADLFTTEEED